MKPRAVVVGIREAVDNRIEITETRAAGALRDDAGESCPQRRRQAGASDAACDGSGAAFVVSPEDSGRIGARNQRDIRNIARTIVRYARSGLISRLAEILARASAARAAAIVPNTFARMTNIVAATGVTRTELRTSNRGDVRIGGHLVDRSRIVYAARTVESGCSVIARRHENALPLQGRLLENRIQRTFDERCARIAEGVADADRAACVIADRAADVADEIAAEMVDDRGARRGCV